MTTQPALDALALIEIVERHIAQPDDTDAYNEEVGKLLTDPHDELIHGDNAARIATELATMVIGIAARANTRLVQHQVGEFRLDEFIADYRRQLLARGDDAEPE
jgi:hypothetical protein